MAQMKEIGQTFQKNQLTAIRQANVGAGHSQRLFLVSMGRGSLR